MRRSDETTPRPADGRGSPRPDVLGWLCLVWAAAFGSLYVAMILRDRAPALLATLRRITLGE